MSAPATIARLRAAGCVFAEDEADLLETQADSSERLEELLRRREAGMPLEHVLGWAELCGVRVEVDAGVFVPRPRSEALARQALGLLAADGVAVDLCCGSGAIAAVLASARPHGELHAADSDPAAVACARRNLESAGVAVHHGDLLGALPARLRGRIDVLVANVPYVPTGELAFLPAEAREHEPALALDGGPDGLAVMRRVGAAAPGWLAPGGSMLCEIAAHQAGPASGLMREAGLSVALTDWSELEATVVVGSRSA